MFSADAIKSHLIGAGHKWDAKSITGVYPSYAAVAAFRQIARADSALLFSAASQTYLEAVSNFYNGRPTWGIIKSYYSCLFCAHAELLRTGLVHFHVEGKPKLLDLRGYKSIETLSGNSHAIIWRLFRSRFQQSILLTDIDGRPAPDWLMRRREHANYQQGDFIDPLIPSPEYMAGNILEKYSSITLAGNAEIYLRDERFLYAFDPDHALLALPAAFVRATAAGSLEAIRLYSHLTKFSRRKLFKTLLRDCSIERSNINKKL